MSRVWWTFSSFFLSMIGVPFLVAVEGRQPGCSFLDADVEPASELLARAERTPFPFIARLLFSPSFSG